MDVVFAWQGKRETGAIGIVVAMIFEGCGLGIFSLGPKMQAPSVI